MSLHRDPFELATQPLASLICPICGTDMTPEQVAMSAVCADCLNIARGGPNERTGNP